MDQNRFFFDVTSRICGTLKIEQGLFNTFQYIKDFIPSDEIYLGIYNIDNRSYSILAHADHSGGYVDRKFFEVDDSVRPALTEYLSNRKVLIVDDCSTEAVVRKFYPEKTCRNSSAMIIPLSLENSVMGVLVIFAGNRSKFTEEHTDLISHVSMPFAIAMANARKYIELTRLKEELMEENRVLKLGLEQDHDRPLIGRDKGLKNVYEMMTLVAPLKNPVLILGETGTGKEVVADTIHKLSLRNNGPFVKVNCGAISPSLLDSELFGHEKGAFTGAFEQQKGKFERADGGTVFLDEIGELTPDAQVRLLRVLQESEIERVGGNRTLKVDIRIIAATHRDLRDMVAKGKFREDLYFRLSVFPIVLPPLRERREDIPDLLNCFILSKCRELKTKVIPEITEDAMKMLLSYDWPGNIRELQNVVERALILERNKPVLTFSDFLPCSLHAPEDTPVATLEDAEKEHIKKALQVCSNKISGKNGAAELLGINPSTLRNRMRRLGLL